MPTPQRHLSVDELSHRASTGLAIRRGDIKISDPIPSSYVHNGAEMDGMLNQAYLLNDNTAFWSGRTGTGMSHGRSGSAPLSSHTAHISRFTERTSPGASFTGNATALIPETEISPQRKDTGLRASLKRMFSKKTIPATAAKRGAYHSDPGRSLTTPKTKEHSHFQSSMQYHAAATGPLNSHATSPLLETEILENLSQSSNTGHPEKRRNTLPTLTLDQLKDIGHSHQQQAAFQQEDFDLARPGTSIPQLPLVIPYLNRRSKSAGALSDLLLPAKKQDTDRRDRSEEIAFWRKSVINDPLPQMPSIESINSRTSFKVQKRLRKQSSMKPRPSIEPPQEFDFGLNDGTDALKSMTIHDRVNTLEVKLFDFEYALAKLQGVDLKKPTLPMKPSPGRSIRSPVVESRTSSTSTNDASCHSSPDEKWSSHVPQQSPLYSQDRTSKATVKAVHPRRPSSRSQVSSPSIYLPRSQYDALQVLIEGEKLARLQLEMKVVSLQQQVENMKYTIGPRHDQYPTPSPDLSQNPAFVMASSSSKPSSHTTPQKATNETSRFSMTETDETETDIDDRQVIPKRLPEVFETPKENTFRFEYTRNSPPDMF